jgi:acetate kinase
VDLAVLTVNAGSTSLKLHLVEGEDSRQIASWDEAPASVGAVAHRVVHGGTRLTEPSLVDDGVVAAIHELEEIAPLHNAPALTALADAQRQFPDVPHVVVFDTAFHTTIPNFAATYALPAQWREEWGIRRFGFHGLSVQWVSERVRASRLVVCHLGGGCSITAVRDGRSVDTTMGFSPLEGVPMATRSGSVDPGALFYVQHRHGLNAEQVEQALSHESGLAGLGGSSSVRELEHAAAHDERARLALDVYSYRIACAVAAMVVAAGGLDGLAFTGGVGENSAWARASICGRLAFLGVALDSAGNASADGDASIAATDSRVHVHVVRAREELVLARAARALLGADAERG